jgi:hypothetical protein
MSDPWDMPGPLEMEVIELLDVRLTHEPFWLAWGHIPEESDAVRAGIGTLRQEDANEFLFATFAGIAQALRRLAREIEQLRGPALDDTEDD